MIWIRPTLALRTGSPKTAQVRDRWATPHPTVVGRDPRSHDIHLKLPSRNHGSNPVLVEQFTRGEST